VKRIHGLLCRRWVGRAVLAGLPFFGASADTAFDDPRLDDSLVNDSSSLILVGEDAALTEFTAAVESFGGGRVVPGLLQRYVIPVDSTSA
jgi:hypothetical protein